MSKQKVSCISLGTQDRLIIKTRFGLIVIDDFIDKNKFANRIVITQAKNKELENMLRNEVGDIGSLLIGTIRGTV